MDSKLSTAKNNFKQNRETKRSNYSKFLSFLLSLAIAITGLGTFFTKDTYAVKLDGNDSIAQSVAEEGIVLLKNENNCLPFNSSTKVGLYGSGQNENYVAGGLGSGWVNTDVINKPIDSFKDAVNKGYIASASTMYTPNQTGFNRVIYFIYRNSTEGGDRTATEGDYYLSQQEKSDISALVKSYPGKVCVVLNVAGIIDTTWLNNNGVSSIVLLWLGGSMGSIALANLMTGRVTPSGKVADTWAKDYNDYLSSAYFSDPYEVKYYEDIFVGYRQFETFDPDYKKVNYEFGFGLSYTSFDIKTNSITTDGEYVKASVTVKNTGNKYSGKEVVQLYYSAPDGKLGNPGKELGAFTKTKVLAPGESQTVNLSFKINDMASYDDTGKIKASHWVLEKGVYSLYIGNSIKNAHQKGVVGTYEVNENVFVKECFKYGTTLDKRLTSGGTFENLETPPKTVHNVNPYGSTYIQTTEYKEKESNTVVKWDFEGFSTKKYLRYRTASVSYSTYSLQVEKAGKYYISLSIASDADRTSVCDIYINGNRQNVSFSAKGNGWSAFSLSEPCEITLPQGNVELKIQCKYKINISHFYIYNNNVSPDGKTIIEAETNNEGGKATVGIFDGVSSLTKGNSVSYTVNAEKAGTYYLSLVYSNTTGAVENAFYLDVNGSVAEKSFSLLRTGFDESVADASETSRFAEGECIEIKLKEGLNKITLTARTRASALRYLDSLIINTDKNNIVYKDNTSSFYTPNLLGNIPYSTITFNQLCDSLRDADESNDLYDEFIDQLSIEEMANMAGLYGFLDSSGTGTGGYGSAEKDYTSGKYGLLPVSTADGPAGIRSTTGEAFTYMPCVSLLASTWNVQLAYKFGEAVGKEAKAAGVGVWLAPGANIHRNPLCGRNFEYISEDPYVSGIMAANIINGCQSQGVGCSIKHLAANNKEDNRTASDSIVSERALREIYLKSFEIAITLSAPETVMTSYNYINGVETAHDSKLLVEIVRNEWGYKGLLISDWGNDINHTLSILGGNNVMCANPDTDRVVRAYVSGYITRETLERNTKYILESMVRVSRPPIKSTLEGHEPINIGGSFYAHIRQTATGLYLTNKNYNAFASNGTFDSSQVWHFIRTPEGAYTIEVQSGGYALDVVGANYNNGTNVQIYEKNNSYAQRFFIYYIDGNYYFKTARGDKTLDIDAKTKNLQIWDCSTGISGKNTDPTSFNARSFEILKLNLDSMDWNLNLGSDYSCFIRNSSSGYLLTAEGDNLFFREPTYSDAQKWIVTRNEYGGHTLKSVLNGKVVDVASGSILHKTTIRLYEKNGTKAQNFFFINAGDGKLYIKPSYSNTVIDMDAGNFKVNACDFGTSQSCLDAQLLEMVTEFYTNESFEKRDPVYFGDTLKVYISSQTDGKSITATDNGVVMADNTGSSTQLWTMTYDREWKAYTITSSSGKVLEIANGNHKDGATVSTRDSDQTPYQKFRFYPSTNGYFISPAHTQRVLDVDEGTGTKLQLFGVESKDNRRFSLSVVSRDGNNALDLGDSFNATIQNKASGLYINDKETGALACSTAKTYWKFTRQPNGAYIIESKTNGKAIDVYSGLIAEGTAVQLWESNGSLAQSFYIYSHNGGYALMSAKTMCVIDMDQNSKELHIYAPKNHDTNKKAQTFALLDITQNEEEKLILNSDSSLVIDGEYLTNVGESTPASTIVSNFKNQNVVVLDNFGNIVSGSDICGTGYKVCLIKDGKTIDSAEIVVWGDVDGNGKVDSTDYLKIKLVFYGTQSVKGSYFLAGDVDSSNRIDSTDYIKLKSHFLSLS